MVICGVGFAFLHSPGTWPNSLADLTIDPLDFLARLAQPWDSRLLLGQDNGSALPYAPIAIAAAVLQALGPPLWLVGRMGIAAVFAGAGLSMMVLTRTFYPAWRVGHWISAFAYMANIFVWVYAKDAVVLLIPYAATPLAIAVFTRGLRQEHLVRQAALLALTSLLFLGISPPSSAIGAVVVIAFALTATVRASDVPLNQRIRYVFVSATFTVAANVWWIVPLFRNLAFHTNVAARSVESPYTDDAYSSYGEVFRLMGNPALYGGWQGQPYYPDGPAFASNPWVIVATYALPLLGAVGIGLMLFRRVPYARVLAGLLVVGLVLAAGIQPPTGQAYLWLYNHMPGAIAFRASYRWVAVLAFVYALGIAYTCEAIRRPYFRDAAVWVAIVAILAQGWPLFTGAVQPLQRLYTIPTYWTTFAHWTNAQSGSFRIAYLPGQFYSIYTWGEPLGEPATVLIHHPSIVEQPGPCASTADGSLLCNELLNELVSGGPQDNVASLLAILDVRYVVERRDVDVNYYGEPSPTQVAGGLAQFAFLRKVATFGALDVYANSLWAESNVRVSGQAQSIAQPLVYDEVRQNGGSWTTNNAVFTQASLSDFTLSARVRITSGQYLGLGFRVGDRNVVAELRVDGSRLEHSIGGALAPFGTSNGSQAETGRYYDVTFTRAGANYSFAVDGLTVAVGEDNDTRAGNIYLAGFNSSMSVAHLNVQGGGHATYNLPLLAQDIGREPEGWSAATSTWAVRPMPLAQAVSDAFQQRNPIVLAELGPSVASWSANIAEYSSLTMADFTASVDITFRDGSDTAIGFKTGTGLLLGELRADGSRIETSQGSAIHTIGTNAGYRIDPAVSHSVSLLRRGAVVELSIDGKLAAQTTNAPTGPATFIISTFQAGISVSDVSLASADGRSYKLDPSLLPTSALAPGWRANSSWTLTRYPTTDTPTSPIPLRSDAPLLEQANGSQVVLTSSDVRNSMATVQVRAAGPFYITLDAAYDPGWVAHIESASGSPALQHFEALGYANGWFIPRGGSVTIVMAYEGNPPWPLWLTGWILVTITLIVVAAWPGRSTRVPR